MKRLRGAVTALAMSIVATALTHGAAPGQQPQPPADPPMPAVLKDYKPVTAERLRKPDDQDWLMIRRTYDGWGFSPLSDITPANVQRLKPVWVFSTAEARVHQAAPLVNGGVMFVTSPNNQVIAIDVKSGNLLWRYRRPLETGMVGFGLVAPELDFREGVDAQHVRMSANGKAIFSHGSVHPPVCAPRRGSRSWWLR